MARLKIIFIVVLVTLFSFIMFTPVSNNTTVSAVANAISSGSVAMPVLAYTPEPYITVTMYVLDENGGSTGTLCNAKEVSWGCSAFCTNSTQCPHPDLEPLPYPYGDTNPIHIPIQTYYLLDVVSQEMSPDLYPYPAALRAQAVAARSYAWWHVENTILSGWRTSINNSNGYQVFVPYRFDALNPKAAPLEPTTAAPCASSKSIQNSSQQLACEAVAPRYYLVTWYRDAPALTEFSSDSMDKTLTYPTPTPPSSPTPFPYLKGVEEPISTSCDTVDSGNRYGMSQNGASRWTRGDKCALEKNGGEPWNVKWTRPEQILFHYYTGVHLRDADNANAILSPDWRWNPLQIDWRTANYQPPAMIAGTVNTYKVQLQNTGIYAWDCHVLPNRPIPPSYRLRYQWLNGQTVLYTGQGTTVCGLVPGNSTRIDLAIQVPVVSTGLYTLRLDIHEGTEDFWFSSGGWPPYDIPVRIESGTTPTPTPTPPGCGFDC